MTTDIDTALSRLARQDQFLEVVDRDEAIARFHRHLNLRPLGSERVPLAQALGRVLAEPVVAGVDVPNFDRSNVDGFAARAGDTVGASERAPKVLRLNAEVLTPGVEARVAVEPGTATLIATGGMVPRGADAVVMVEHTETRQQDGATLVEIRRPAAAGQLIAFAGSDLARGETVVRTGQVITSREIAMIAAVGCAHVPVWRRPKVAVISTGDELVLPGEPLRPGAVYDSNAAILAAAVEEAGGTPVTLGIGRDDEGLIVRLVSEGLASCDMVLMSGGTSKGVGDVCYRAVARFSDPGVVVHGVAIKPGKPVCLAVTAGKPVVVLPGFPTSAIFTFHELVAPVVRALAGLPRQEAERLEATLPLTVASERGRTEFKMVSLVPGAHGDKPAAYPIAKDSGAVTAFSHADGFIAVGQHVESLAAGTPVSVRLIGRERRLADLTIIGSHCIGLDVLIERLESRWRGREGHERGQHRRPRRRQARGVRCGADPPDGPRDRRLQPAVPDGRAGAHCRVPAAAGPRVPRGRPPVCRPLSAPEALAAALADPGCLMVGRNAGSGTRILLDRLLEGKRPAGYWSQPRSHNAVAVAVAQGRADWGVTIQSVARQYDLGFIPVQDEHYDFVVPQSRLDRPAVQKLRALLEDASVRAALAARGFEA